MNLWLQLEEGWIAGILREFGMNIFILLYLKWIINKDLLDSTWNSAECYVAAWMGGSWGKMDTCICMADSLSCLPETITTWLIAYAPNKIKSFFKKDMGYIYISHILYIYLYIYIYMMEYYSAIKKK